LNGHSLDELPYRASGGVWGSWLCLLINVIALIASFYVALYPVGGPYLSANGFFIAYLAGPLIVFLYLCWKTYSWFYVPAHRPLWVALDKIDIYSGMRENVSAISGRDVPEETRRASIAEMQASQKKGAAGRVMGAVRQIF
jgi:yeast amino acid transporter